MGSEDGLIDMGSRNGSLTGTWFGEADRIMRRHGSAFEAMP
jgi:hypothetical protein